MILALVFIVALTIVGFSAWMAIINLVKVAVSLVGLAFALLRLAVASLETALNHINRRRRAMETNP